MSSTAIADHALLSDRHSSALVSNAGSVEWLSFPRFDSPSVFGRLLGAEAGHWQIQPVGKARSTRRYVDRTLVLETTFTTATGTLVLTDLLAMGPDNGGHRLGRDVPHLLVRRATCTTGEELPSSPGNPASRCRPSRARSRIRGERWESDPRAPLGPPLLRRGFAVTAVASPCRW
jgi:hypothetical protein